MPSLIADKTTGLHLCIAVLGALYHRKCTGEGQMIEVPMLETLASFWLTEHLFGETWTPGRGAMGYDRIINKFRHPFPTKDGYICALPYTDAHWVTVLRDRRTARSRQGPALLPTARCGPSTSASSTRCSIRC